MPNENEKWMRRCIQLAKNGLKGAAPNPMVGAVIVCDGKIIGEGYHVHCGESHAEVNAIASVCRRDLLKSSTMYVSLEPCSHHGKTPPCADLIIREGIPHVVIGCIDPFAKVQGRGINKLRNASVKVTVGVCEEECLNLNRRFITYQTEHRPYVTLKWAQSADGYIDYKRDNGAPIILSTPLTLTRVHRFRSENQAIMVGRRTAELDNPSLTVRYWSGKNPLRVVMDRYGRLNPLSAIFDGTVPTLVICDSSVRREIAIRYDGKNITAFSPDYNRNIISQILSYLYELNIQTLMVEGGARLLDGFIENDLWDEAYVEKTDYILTDGVSAPVIDSDYISDVDDGLGTKTFCYRNFRVKNNTAVNS